MKPPKWATALLAKVAKDEGRDDIPMLEWRYIGAWSSSGVYYHCQNRILVRTSPGNDLEKAGRFTLLHEISHWLAGPLGHTPEFWDKAWDLYHRYGVDIGYARRREQSYRTASVAAYHRYQNGEKYQEWQPKGEPRPLGDFAEGDYVVLQPGKRYGKRSWYYGWVRHLSNSGTSRYFEDTEGRSWYLATDTEAWTARRRAKKDLFP